ncbi:hypothetical protein AB0J80_03245 [Actinoplanes sp. NPDC049548]|uniref:hypothetical protein n=1 Tax=Actinoplanes sp. NPDC049548 TaxID=3155152 RepID=UPI00343A382E
MAYPGDQSAGERHERRAAEAHDRAEKARQRAEEAADSLAQLRRAQELADESGAGPQGSTACQVEHAKELAEESRRRNKTTA